MSATQLGKELRALCHEHHLEMKRNKSFSNGDGGATQVIVYACTAPDCHVHYNVSRGYFILNQNGNGNEWDQTPKVKCSLDGAPMYLAQIDREKRAFRLWRCPQCGANITNEEGLVGLASMNTQDVVGKSEAQP
jgi:hypothetical protein